MQTEYYSNDLRNVPSPPRKQVDNDMIASIFRTGTCVEPALLVRPLSKPIY